MPPFLGRTSHGHARWVAAVIAMAAFVTACSGSESAEPTLPAPPASTTAVPTPTAAPMITEPEIPVEPPGVRIDVSVGGTGVELSGLLSESFDPFGQFVSCSGLRATYGTYSVLASVDSGPVRSVSVVSADLVPAPGVHDAAIRVEFESAPPVDAAGTITVGGDRRTGSFIGFDATGAQVEGTFDCRGGEADPQPLVVGSDDGVLEAVEVFALLRRGDQQRILGLATPADGAALVECAGAEGAEDGALTGVRVVGDDTVGAVTSFELGDGPMPELRLRAGSVVYTAEQATRGGADLATAGSFSADANGVAVDGAFRCS